MATSSVVKCADIYYPFIIQRFFKNILGRGWGKGTGTIFIHTWYMYTVSKSMHANSDLNNINVWLKTNKRRLNVTKIKYVLIESDHNLNKIKYVVILLGGGGVVVRNLSCEISMTHHHYVIRPTSL